MTKMKIKLIEAKGLNKAEELQTPLCVCDFYIKGAEDGHIRNYGIVYKDILNIDHHAPVSQMERQVSSTNLAIKYVKQHGITKMPIVINHTDCDSILSSMIMSGELKPSNIYGNAAISADHTGERNNVADLLQALETLRDLDYSKAELKKILSGSQIDQRAKSLLEKRLNEREGLKDMVGNFQYTSNGIVYLQTENRVSGEFLPPLLPDANIIIVGTPMDNGKLGIKARLGLNSNGIKLNQLDLPDFGGRWNAGSTKRHGGTSHSLKEYAEIVDSKISN